MKKIKALALISAMSIIAATATTPAFAKVADVNVAEGKYVTSSKFGGGSWDGGDNTVDKLVDGGKDVYVSPLPEYGTDVITIDLLGDYTVTGVEIETYGNDDPADAFYMTDSTFKVVAKQTLDDAGVELTRKMNGESGYFPIDGGAYFSDFEISGSDKYRYVEVTYTEGANSMNGKEHVDARIPEIKVFAPASEAVDEESKWIAPVSFDKPVKAGCDPTWGAIANVTDGTCTTNYYAYGRSDGEAWVVIDLGCAYPLTMVVPDMQIGGISDVIVSNKADFSEEEYLEENADGTWTLSENAPETSFRYVKCIPTVAQSSATDHTLSTSYGEVVVYSTVEARDKIGTLENIKSTATMTVDGYDAFWPVAQAVDGSVDTAAGIYGYQDHQYIQADMGRSQDIKSITVTNANEWGWTGAGKVKTIRLSNDPNFTTYEEMVCSERLCDFDNRDYVDYISEWTYSGDKAFRYVRLYGTPASTHYANWGTDETLSFLIKEMDIFAAESSVALTNAISGRSSIIINNDYLFGTTGANLVDGNKDTVAYATNLAVFELDYPMEFDRIEIDFRADGEVTDADRHYDVYLSNTGTTEGAVQLLASETSHAQVAYNTIVLPVESEEKYKYVLVGSDANFWGLTEARAMTNDTVSSAEFKREFDDTVAFEPGETQKYTMTFRSPSVVEKTVRPIIARFDNGKMTDVKFGDVTTISGTYDVVEMEYTLDSEAVVDGTTILKAFVWEIDAENADMTPFCKTKAQR